MRYKIGKVFKEALIDWSNRVSTGASDYLRKQFPRSNHMTQMDYN